MPRLDDASRFQANDQFSEQNEQLKLAELSLAQLILPPGRIEDRAKSPDRAPIHVFSIPPRTDFIVPYPPRHTGQPSLPGCAPQPAPRVPASQAPLSAKIWHSPALLA